MDIGQLRHRGTFLVESSSQDGIGQLVPTWTAYASNVHCRVRHMGGAQEGQKAGAVTSLHRVEIRTRYRTDITPAMRFTHRSKSYKIIGVRPNEMNLEWTDIDCELIE